jgi:hypothetical protein
MSKNKQAVKKILKNTAISLAVLLGIGLAGLLCFFLFVLFMFSDFNCVDFKTTKNFPNDNYGTLRVYGNKCGIGAGAEQDLHGYTSYELTKGSIWWFHKEIGKAYAGKPSTFFDTDGLSAKFHDADTYFMTGKASPLPYTYKLDTNELIMDNE